MSEPRFLSLDAPNTLLLNGEDASIAILISREHKTAEALLQNVLHAFSERKVIVDHANIYSTSSIKEMPLLAQALAETMLYDAVLLLDISSINSTNQLMQNNELLMVMNALYQSELDSGLTLIKGLERVSENEFESADFIQSKAKYYADTTIEAMNLVNVIRAIGLMNDDEHELEE